MKTFPSSDSAQTPANASEKHQWPPVWVIALWLLGLISTALLTLAVHNYQTERLQARFNNEVLRVADDIERRFKLPVYGLTGARGVYAASEEVSRSEFLSYVNSRNLQDEFPGVRGMGFIERVPRTELNAFVERERADGAPDFAVRSVSQVDQPDLYVIKYIEPLARNRSAQGLDIGSEAVRREGAERAARTGQPALSGVIQLVQDQLSRPGFLLYVPVYRPGLPLDTPEQRQAALHGMTYSPIVLHELLQPAEALLLGTGLHISIVDQTVGEASEPLLNVGTANEKAWLRTERPLATGSSGLVLQAHTTTAFEATANRWLVYGLGASGLFLSSLLAWVLWLQATARARAEARAKGMTVDLQKLALVAQRTANSVLMTDAQLRITWVNEGFTRITGYSADEALGKTPGELLDSSNASAETLATLRHSAERGLACRVEILNRTKDGREYWVDTELQPVRDEAGQLTGFIKIGLDITQERATNHRLVQALMDSAAQQQELDLLARVVRTTSNAVVVTNEQGHIEWVNEGFTRITGYALAEVAGERLGSRVRCPETDQATMAEIDAALADARPCHVEILNRSKQGRLQWLEVEVQPLLDAAGRHTGFMTLESDISQRREILDNLKRASLENQSLMSAINQGAIYSVGDLQGDIIDINDEFARISGYTREELIGANHRMLNSGSHSGSFWENVWATISAGHMWRGEVCNRAKSGSLYWVDSTIVPFIGVDGLVEKYISIRTDITAIKVAHLENQSLMSAINQGAIYSVADVQGNIIDINDEFVRISGYTRDELIGANHRLLNSGSHAESFWERVWVTISAGHMWRGEVCNRAKSGSLYWVNSTIVPFIGVDGLVEKYISIRTDITAIKAAQLEIDAQKDRLDNILQGTNVGTWEWHIPTGKTLFNERWAEIVGYTLQELEPVSIDTWMRLAHPDDLLRSSDALQRHFSGELDYYDCESRMRHKDGHWVWVLDRGQVASREADGSPGWMYGTHQDITLRKETEVRIARSEALLDRTSQIAKVGAWRIDLETGQPEWSAETCRIHEVPVGYQPSMEEAINFYAPEARPIIVDLVNKGMQTGEPWDVELPFVTAKGRHIWVRTLGELEFQQGKPVALVGGFQDITDRQEIARLQSEARERAEQASLAKSAFLANMSHEIRTPLNAVLGMHRMLQATDLQPGQSALLGKANQAGHGLMDIINNVLDLAKIEAGEMSTNAQPFQPRQLFEELIDVHGVVAQAKGLKLTLDTAADLPVWIVGDRSRLRQVLSNLLGNALKFTTTGAVTLSTRVRRDASQPWIELVVRDSGVGISEEAIGRLFTPFVQADESTTRQFGGTGLGLSIVRNIAQMMGGDAQVSSTLGVGSEFMITLPLIEADERTVAQATRASRPIEVALMCADEAICQEMGQRLAAMGWSCFRPMAAETGEPDVLLMDAALGSEGAVRLRELVDAAKTQGHDLPAIVLGDAQELVAMESLALPLHRVVLKPANMSSIFNKVVEVLALGEDSQDRLLGSTHAIEGGIQWLQGARILVVDDSVINLEIAVALLEQQGATCHTRSNGQEAADWLFAHPEEVDAVLMDVQMPVMDGLAATRLIKSHAAFKSLPVIALTAGALDSERLRAKAAGMDDFLTKPLEPLDVMKLLRSKIGLYRGKAPQVVLNHSGEEAVSLDTSKPQPWPEIAGINKTLAVAYSSNSVVLFNKLLALVQKNYSGWGVTWLELAHQKGAGINADLRASLHKMRGSAGMLGAVELATVAEQAETSILDDSVLPLEAVKRVAAVLDELLARIEDHKRSRHSNGPVIEAPGSLTSSGRQKLRSLAEMLARCDFDAIDLGLSLRHELVSLLGQDGAAELLQKMDELDFSAAHSRLMNQLQQSGVAA